MSLVTICGAECGIVTTGLAGTAANRHWTKGSGTPTVDTGTVRSGARSYKMAAVAAVNPYLARTCAASQTVGYQRVYFRMDALPSAATPSTTTPDILYCFTSSVSGQIRLSNVGVLSACWNDTVSQTGPTLAVNTWYGIEVEWDVSANPNVIRWRYWSSATGWVSQTNATNAVAAQTITDMEFGFTSGSGNGAHPTSGMNIYFDDIIVGEGTSVGADYSTTTPRGGTVPRLRPTSDGTHSFTAGDFGYDAAGGDIATNATDVWSYVDDDDQTSILDGVLIRQKVIRTTGYVAVAMADTTDTSIGALAVTSTHHSSSTGANQQSVRISDNAWTNETQVWNTVDVSDATAHFLHKVVATPPSGGTWTTEKVNSTQLRLGYSGDVTDVPYWDSVSLEVEVNEARVPYLTPYPQVLPQ